MRYINELRDGENIVEFYLCKQRQSFKSAKTGKTYLSLTLLDKTGTINGKVWDLSNKIQSFEEGNFIKVEAAVQSYNNELQLNIKQIRRADEGEYDEADYIPSTDKDINELYSSFRALIASIENPYIKKLLNAAYPDNSPITTEFKKHTAAKTMHHNYLGGLLEHSLSVAQLCDMLSKQYPFADRDVLVASALLHDIGKLKELSDFPAIDYTDDGELLGHIVMGANLVGKLADEIDGFPHELKVIIQHCILSHHGEYEYGSPKLPKTIEALLLHFADDIDAKAKMFEEAIKTSDKSTKWTDYNKILATRIRKTTF
jgi:3'-5' exoribonuclease